MAGPKKTPEEKERAKKRSQRRKANEKSKAKRSLLTCSFLTLAGAPCMQAVWKQEVDGRCFCHSHWRKWNSGAQAQMEMRMVEHSIDQYLNHKGKPTPEVPAVIAKTVDDAINRERELYRNPSPMEPTTPEGAASNRIRFMDQNPNFKHGGRCRSEGFQGLDVDYYAPDYTSDHVELLEMALKRAHATVNVLFQQLRRIEEEEEQIKMTEMEGTQIVEGVPTDFSSRTRRHAVPFEMKIKLIDALTKAEARYAALLQQKEGLLLNCLLVLRKIGVKWSREAGMMVVEAIESKELSALQGHGLIDDFKKGPGVIDTQANVKSPLRDDDW